jgi:hypothetical protein
MSDQDEEDEEQEGGVHIDIDACQPANLPGPTHDPTSAVTNDK